MFTKKDNTEIIQMAKCPICSSFILHAHYMKDAKTGSTSMWYQCTCGVIWNKDTPKYQDNDVNRYKDGGVKYKDSCIHPVTTYAPIIEESVYGRKVLEIGHIHPYHVEALANRGWVTYSIDQNPGHIPSERMIVADFESHEFDTQFNLIWASNIIETFRDPLAAFIKMYKMLSEDGILFLATPDVDFLHTRSSSNFNHWKPGNHIMWNRRSLTSNLEKLGFETILCRRNHEHRFDGIDSLHGIFQKRFF